MLSAARPAAVAALPEPGSRSRLRNVSHAGRTADALLMQVRQGALRVCAIVGAALLLLLLAVAPGLAALFFPMFVLAVVAVWLLYAAATLARRSSKGRLIAAAVCLALAAFPVFVRWWPAVRHPSEADATSYLDWSPTGGLWWLLAWGVFGLYFIPFRAGRPRAERR